MRICPRSAPPSTPNDRFDPFSSRPSSPPRLPSTPKRHLQVRTLFLKTAACFHAFMDFCSCLLAGETDGTHVENGSFHIKKKPYLSATPWQSATNRRSGGAVMLEAACTGSLIGRSIMGCGRHRTGREMRVIAGVSGKGATNACCL